MGWVWKDGSVNQCTHSTVHACAHTHMHQQQQHAHVYFTHIHSHLMHKSTTYIHTDTICTHSHHMHKSIIYMHVHSTHIHTHIYAYTSHYIDSSTTCIYTHTSTINAHNSSTQTWQFSVCGTYKYTHEIHIHKHTHLQDIHAHTHISVKILRTIKGYQFLCEECFIIFLSRALYSTWPQLSAGKGLFKSLCVVVAAGGVGEFLDWTYLEVLYQKDCTVEVFMYFVHCVYFYLIPPFPFYSLSFSFLFVLTTPQTYSNLSL